MTISDRLAIGIDTGGTYTDAVVTAAKGGEVISTAKALTTPDDLAVGVAEALTGALELAIDRTFDLADAEMAHYALETRSTTGKLLLRI